MIQAALVLNFTEKILWEAKEEIFAVVKVGSDKAVDKDGRRVPLTAPLTLERVDLVPMNFFGGGGRR